MPDQDKKPVSRWQLYSKLAWSTFKLSAFTFGGGYVIVPLLRKRFVEDYQWIAEDEMLDLVAIAQSSPGSIAVNASIMIGYRLAGFAGACLATVMTILPAMVIIGLISSFYDAFKANIYVNILLKGMAVGVVAVIMDVVISLLGQIIRRKDIWALVIFGLALLASSYFHLSVAVIILVAACLGLVGRKKQ